MEFDKTSRRSVLRKAVISAAGVAALSSVSSATPASKRKHMDEVDVSRVPNVARATVGFFEDGGIVFEAEGSNAETEDDVVLRLGARDHFDKRGNLRANRGRGVITDKKPKKAQQVSESGGTPLSSGTKPSDSGVQSQTVDSSDCGCVTTSAVGDIDDSDGGTDHTTDYRGGLQAQLYEVRWGDVNHGQTVRWESSSGEVSRYYDRAICWYLGPHAADGVDHEYTGYVETDWSGDTCYSESVSQFYTGDNGVQGGYRSYHHSGLTMRPNGKMDWWGRVYTTGNGYEFNQPNTKFEMKSGYWQYCADW